MKKNKFDVDVDNPGFQAEADPILAHSNIAHVYHYRPPYEGEFFRRAATKMNIAQPDHLIDLCCGRGELAIGFSKYAEKITGVDGSKEMLKHATMHPRVHYELADVNMGQLGFREPADHIVIGSAIHWISGMSLFQIIKEHLKPSGHILISHTLFKLEDTGYGAAIQAINSKYGKVPRSVDLWGVEKLAGCGLVRTDGLRIARKLSLSIEFIYKNQLSYAYGRFHDNLRAMGQLYRAEMLDALSKFTSDGHLSATLVNWGEIYTRKN